MSQAVFSLVSTIGGLLVVLFVLRFIFQATQANFFNPICQAVNRISSVPMAITRGVLPDIGPVSLNALVWAILTQAVVAGGLAVLFFATFPNPVQLLMWSAVSVVGLGLNILFFALIVMIILSWVAPQAQHPGAELVWQVTEPVMAPVRKVMPDLGGIDLSPIAVFFVLQMLSNGVVGGLATALRTPSQLFIGV